MAKEPRTIVKEVPHARLYSDGTILLMDVRFSYPHVLTPFEGKDDQGNAKKNFGVVALMPKKPAYFEAKDIVKGQINKLLAEAKIKELPDDRKFLRDGDKSGKTEHEKMFTVNASETKAPQVRDKYRDPKTGKPKILKAGTDDDRIYGGCWGNVLIRPWFQNNKYGKRVNAGLVAVQFGRDDESFGEGRISADEVDETFEDFSDEDSGFSDELGEDDEL